MRHGQSLANVQNVIVSHPEHGVSGYGLSETGKAQVQTTIERLQQEHVLDENVHLISSDFLRCKETSKIVQSVLGLKDIHFDIRLRERQFGSLELKSLDLYKKVWEADQFSNTQREHGVESVQAVFDRVWPLVEELETLFEEKTFLFVSHGDPLQILLTGFLNLEHHDHHAVDYFKPAEVRGPYQLN